MMRIGESYNMYVAEWLITPFGMKVNQNIMNLTNKMNSLKCTWTSKRCSKVKTSPNPENDVPLQLILSMERRLPILPQIDVVLQGYQHIVCISWPQSPKTLFVL